MEWLVKALETYFKIKDSLKKRSYNKKFAKNLSNKITGLSREAKTILKYILVENRRVTSDEIEQGTGFTHKVVGMEVSGLLNRKVIEVVRDAYNSHVRYLKIVDSYRSALEERINKI